MHKIAFLFATFLLTASMTASMATGAAAKDDTSGGKAPTWRQQLEYQLSKERGCQVNYLSNVIVKDVNGEETVLARAHCMDNRAFDVSRSGSDKPFEIKACGQQTC